MPLLTALTVWPPRTSIPWWIPLPWMRLLKTATVCYATDIAGATAENPARLRVLGSMAAGGEEDIRISAGDNSEGIDGGPSPERRGCGGIR